MSRPPSPPPSTRNNNTFSPDQPAQYLSSITQYGSFRTIAAFLGTFPYPPTPRAHAQLFYTVPADDSTFLHRLCFRGVTPALLETIAEKVAEKVQHSTHGNLFSLSDSRCVRAMREGPIRGSPEDPLWTEEEEGDAPDLPTAPEPPPTNCSFVPTLLAGTDGRLCTCWPAIP